MRHIAYIDMKVKVDEESLGRCMDYMEMLKDELETAGNCYGEVLAYEVREGDADDYEEVQ